MLWLTVVNVVERCGVKLGKRMDAHDIKAVACKEGAALLPALIFTLMSKSDSYGMYWLRTVHQENDRGYDPTSNLLVSRRLDARA